MMIEKMNIFMNGKEIRKVLLIKYNSLIINYLYFLMSG
mgnify:FL=1